MRVGIDGHMVGGQETGNETYIKGLVDGLAELKPELDALVFHVDGPWASARPSLTFQRLVTGSPYFRLVVDLPARSVTQRLDVLHMTYAAPVWSAAPIVLTVHDICYATNLERLIQAFQTLVRDIGHDIDLVIVGPKRFHADLIVDAARSLADRVHFTGYVTDTQLAACYRCCTTFVFPSLYEGFGLPALEAMAQGAPVACSTAGALPEVCGRAAVYFDPRSVDAMADAVEKILGDAGLRRSLVEAGLS